MPETPITADPSTRPVLLCVDDEPSILSALRRLFRANGFQVLTAESGQQGLELLMREKVDLVISDMRMPEMDGVAFLEHVRQRKPDILRLLLTGYADINSIMGAINRGEIYRYISKPWDDHDIILIVRGALERSALEAEKKRLEALVLEQNEVLKRMNASLEVKVAERTAELRHSNEALQGANDRLKNNFLTSIKMFTALIELRDPKLAGHSRRVADLARRLAQGLQLDQRQVQEIFVASLLHAIGKVGFDDELLSTPLARMTPRQMESYRQHPQRAEQLLMPLNELKGAIEMIVQQLERHDGTGFPQGLGGRHICVGARVLAVAVTFDNLQISQVEPRAFSRTEARQYIQHRSGSDFDPAVVTLLMALQQTESDEPANSQALPTRSLQSRELQPGMVLSKDLITPSGMLLLTAGHVLEQPVIRQIINFERSIEARLSVQVQLPASKP